MTRNIPRVHRTKGGRTRTPEGKQHYNIIADKGWYPTRERPKSILIQIWSCHSLFRTLHIYRRRRIEAAEKEGKLIKSLIDDRRYWEDSISAVTLALFYDVVCSRPLFIYPLLHPQASYNGNIVLIFYGQVMRLYQLVDINNKLDFGRVRGWRERLWDWINDEQL